mgnify:CR=1 FL=1
MHASQSGPNPPAPIAEKDAAVKDLTQSPWSWLIDIDYDCMVLGIAKVNHDGVEIAEIIETDGQFNETPDKLLGYCNSLLFVWFNMKTPVLLDFDACECVGTRMLMRGKTRRFIIHGVLLDESHIGFIIVSQAGRWDIDYVKSMLKVKEAQIANDTRKHFTAQPFFTESAVHFTAREIEILQLLGEGSTNKLIGKSLGISHNTVRNQVQALFRKTSTSNRTQLAQLSRLIKTK